MREIALSLDFKSQSPYLDAGVLARHETPLVRRYTWPRRHPQTCFAETPGPPELQSVRAEVFDHTWRREYLTLKLVGSRFGNASPSRCYGESVKGERMHIYPWQSSATRAIYWYFE